MQWGEEPSRRVLQAPALEPALQAGSAGAEGEAAERGVHRGDFSCC